MSQKALPFLHSDFFKLLVLVACAAIANAEEDYLRKCGSWEAMQSKIRVADNAVRVNKSYIENLEFSDRYPYRLTKKGRDNLLNAKNKQIDLEAVKAQLVAKLPATKEYCRATYGGANE